jgi:D-arabinose 1-dehydrogenase-like Zn-dependent alcohol dehydrogenase
MGHEAIGVVGDIGSEVRGVKRGDVAVMPFAISDGTCEFCQEGLTTACRDAEVPATPANTYAGSGRSRSTSSRAGRPSNRGRTSGR